MPKRKRKSNLKLKQLPASTSIDADFQRIKLSQIILRPKFKALKDGENSDNKIQKGIKKFLEEVNTTGKVKTNVLKSQKKLVDENQNEKSEKINDVKNKKDVLENKERKLKGILKNGEDIEVAEETSDTDGNRGKIAKLKLKLTRNDLGDKEYELVKSPDRVKNCLHCNCDSALKQLPRGVIQEKVKAFNESISDDQADIDLSVVDDMLANLIVNEMVYKNDVAALRKENLALYEEYERLRIPASRLIEEVSCAQYIIQRLINEKIAYQALTEEVAPVRVARSVGLQVCTAGSPSVFIRPAETNKEAANSLTNPSAETTPATICSMPVPVEAETGNVIAANHSKNATEDAQAVEPVNTNTVSSELSAILAQLSMAATEANNSLQQASNVVPKPQQLLQSAQNGRPLLGTVVAQPAEHVIDLTADDTHLRAVDNVLKRSRNSGNTQLRHATTQTNLSNVETQLYHSRSLPPLPLAPEHSSVIAIPPKPIVGILKYCTGLVIFWSFDGVPTTAIKKYHVYSYQEGASMDAISREYWKKVSEVNALTLPMSVFLTQVEEGQKYFFVVRAEDDDNRLGEFSQPVSITI